MQRVKAHLKALGKALANSASILVCQISRASQLFLIKRSEYQLGKVVAQQDFDHLATKQLAYKIRDMRQRLSTTQANAGPEGQNWWGRSVHRVKFWVKRVWLKVSIIRQELRLGQLVRSEPMNKTSIPPEHSRRFGELTARIADVRADEQALRNSTPWLLRQPILLVIMALAGLAILSSTLKTPAFARQLETSVRRGSENDPILSMSIADVKSFFESRKFRLKEQKVGQPGEEIIAYGAGDVAVYVTFKGKQATTVEAFCLGPQKIVLFTLLLEYLNGDLFSFAEHDIQVIKNHLGGIIVGPEPKAHNFEVGSRFARLAVIEQPPLNFSVEQIFLRITWD